MVRRAPRCISMLHAEPRYKALQDDVPTTLQAKLSHLVETNSASYVNANGALSGSRAINYADKTLDVLTDPLCTDSCRVVAFQHCPSNVVSFPNVSRLAGSFSRFVPLQTSW